MRHTAILATLLLSLGAIACGGDDGGPSLPDASGDGDGDGDGDADAAVAACAAIADFGAATMAGQQGVSVADGDGMGNAVTSVFGGLNADAAPDILALDVWDGYGAFAGGTAAPGTYTISGPEVSPADCGVCAYIVTDFVDADNQGPLFFATGGTVEITTLTPNITGTISGLTITHVDVDQMTGAATPNASGCTSSITSVSFDALVMAQ